MKTIQWEEYLERKDLQTCTREQIEKEEKEVGFIFPELLKQIIMEHGGQKPVNLIPKYANGTDMSIPCIFHAYSNDKEDYGYTISSATECLVEEDYLNYVVFCNKGNVFVSLDYNVRPIDPPVVMVIRDSLPDDPDHRHFLAENFHEFLDKYTV
ncbi:SMI1/KNR4 family protein [Litoribacillus peritrichatus]|uniref:Knr4/Smi1-like domain-containing protein n=1 Tax=Litoribacillus peritrichatus TaxID=718191 RepID=A0ABP7MIA8_9GAMM